MFFDFVWLSIVYKYSSTQNESLPFYTTCFLLLWYFKYPNTTFCFLSFTDFAVMVFLVGSSTFSSAFSSAFSSTFSSTFSSSFSSIFSQAFSLAFCHHFLQHSLTHYQVFNTGCDEMSFYIPKYIISIILIWTFSPLKFDKINKNLKMIRAVLTITRKPQSSLHWADNRLRMIIFLLLHLSIYSSLHILFISYTHLSPQCSLILMIIYCV